MNITRGPPHSVGGSVAVDVMVGVKVGVGVSVAVGDGVIDAVGVAVGGLIISKAAQPETMDRISREQSNTIKILNR